MYTCVHPADRKMHVNLEDRFSDISIIKDWFKECLELTKDAYFSTDMPLPMLDFYEKNVISQMIYMKGYQDNEKSMLHVQDMIRSFYAPWKGFHTHALDLTIQQQATDVDLMRVNSTFKWYVNHVAPRLSEVAMKEASREFTIDDRKKPLTSNVFFFVE